MKALIRRMTSRATVATLLLVLFTGAQIVSAAPSDPKGSSGRKTFWGRHGKVEDLSKKEEESLKSKLGLPAEAVPLQLANLRIPVQYGSLKKIHEAKEPIIIHIQDAHANYEAQKNLSSILEYLILAHGLSLILVEGGSRDDSLSYMRAYAPLEKRKQVAEDFLKAGKISGENYLDLTSDYNFTVYGIEKPELYDENMEAFFNVEKVQPKALVAIEGFLDAVGQLKGEIYPDEVKLLELKEAEVKDGRVPLAQHYETLAKEADKVNIEIRDAQHPNLMKFLKASRLEKALDFKNVEIERTRFLESLTRSLPKSEMDELLKQSLDLKKGLITPASFYGHLKSFLRPQQSSEYPVLTQYIAYLEFFADIDHASLFVEVEGVSESIKKTYFTNKDQRDLFLVAKDVDVLADLLELKLTPDSYEYYKSHKSEFKPDRWANKLRALGKKQSPTLGFTLSPAPLSAAMPAMASFYVVARKRDLVMVENALKQIEAFDVPFAVMIAGGFHTPAFERLFQDRKVSYAVVAPKVGKVTPADTEKYHRVLKETYVPMSEKYRNKLGTPSVPPAVSSTKREKATRAASSNVRPVAYTESSADRRAVIVTN